MALGHLVMSVPTSLITFRAVYASTPSMRVRSTPVIRYRWLWTSKRGAFFWLRFLPLGAGGWPSLRSSNRSSWASISRSHSAILPWVRPIQPQGLGQLEDVLVPPMPSQRPGDGLLVGLAPPLTILG